MTFICLRWLPISTSISKWTHSKKLTNLFSKSVILRLISLYKPLPNLKRALQPGAKLLMPSIQLRKSPRRMPKYWSHLRPFWTRGMIEWAGKTLVERSVRSLHPLSTLTTVIPTSVFLSEPVKCSAHSARANSGWQRVPPYARWALTRTCSALRWTCEALMTLRTVQAKCHPRWAWQRTGRPGRNRWDMVQLGWLWIAMEWRVPIFCIRTFRQQLGGQVCHRSSLITVELATQLTSITHSIEVLSRSKETNFEGDR